MAEDLAESDNIEPRVASLTQTGRRFPTGLAGGIDKPGLYATYTSFKLAENATCSVGNWVFATLGTHNPDTICRVEEIISVVAVDGHIPVAAEAVLLQRGILGNHVEPYLMPSISVDDEQMLLLSPAVCAYLFQPS